MRLATTCVLVIAALSGCQMDEGGVQEEAISGALPRAGAEPELVSAMTANAFPGHTYGQVCAHNADCGSEICYQGQCSQVCDASVVNSCRAVDAFCVGDFGDKNVCFGHLVTGSDVGDDRMLALGDFVRGKLNVAGDADMYELALDAGDYQVTAIPAQDGDVRLEIYDELTKNELVRDDARRGLQEQVIFHARAPGRYFVVVRDAIGSPANYSVNVKPL